MSYSFFAKKSLKQLHYAKICEQKSVNILMHMKICERNCWKKRIWHFTTWIKIIKLQTFARYEIGNCRLKITNAYRRQLSIKTLEMEILIERSDSDCWRVEIFERVMVTIDSEIKSIYPLTNTIRVNHRHFYSKQN